MRLAVCSSPATAPYSGDATDRRRRRNNRLTVGPEFSAIGARHHLLKRVLEQLGFRASSILIERRRRGAILKKQLERASVDGFFGREVDGRRVVVVPDMLFHGRLRVLSVPREAHI